MIKQDEDYNTPIKIGINNVDGILLYLNDNVTYSKNIHI